jgi:phosphate-selective porin OprO/OprP
MQLPFGRAEPTDDFGLMFVDRSLPSELFSAGRSMGLMLHGGLFDRKLDYYLAVTNGLNNNLDSVDDPDAANELDTNPAVTARAVWHAMYDQLGKDFLTESDITYHKKPALDFGTSFAFNKNVGDEHNVFLPFSIPDAVRVGPGGFGLVPDTEGTDITQWGADAAFKYLGFSVQAEYFLRMINSSTNASDWFLATTDGGSTHQQGAYVQAGYFIVPEKLELAARVGGVWDFADDNMWEYSAGVNYYIRGNNLKLQADFTRVYEAPIADNVIEFMNQNDDMTLFRVQLQASF